MPAFARATAELRDAGYEVVSPVEVGKAAALDENTAPWEAFIREDVRALIDCGGIALLDGWSASRGAALEVQIACALKMPVLPLADWLAT